jgi:site-specific DNA-cytosine methylase
MARIIEECKPTWVIAENVAGIINMELDKVLSDLEGSGYTTWPLVIPACAVDAPHRRDRVWILAYSNGSRDAQSKLCNTDIPTRSGKIMANSSQRENNGRKRRDLAKETVGREGKHTSVDFSGKDVADAPESRFSKWGGASLERSELQPELERCDSLRRKSTNWLAEPAVGRVANGIPFGLEYLGGRIDEEGNNTKTHTEACFAGWKVLRELWEHRELAEASPYILAERLRDIVPELPYSSGFARWIKKAENDEELRNLWEQFYAASFQEAQDLQQALLERVGAEERKQTLAFKRSRVSRLKSLGNAIVPQVAQVIMQAIKEFERTST